MKKLIAYVVVMGWLFALLDWQVIHFTRWGDRSRLEWMHAHEQHYALVTRGLELILCAPALALKPVFQEALLRVEASQDEQDAITHAPGLSVRGFYHLPRRGEAWTFVPWWTWFTYWLGPSLLWYLLAGKLRKK